MWMPFICLAAGALVAPYIKGWSERLLNYSLFLLLFGLGTRIGLNQELLASIPRLGLTSLVICLFSSAASIGLVVLWGSLFLDANKGARAEDVSSHGQDLLRELFTILSVVAFLGTGMATGYLLRPPEQLILPLINLSLIAIYVSVGVGLKDGITGLKNSPRKSLYIFLPLVITAGSIIGGVLAGFLSHSNLRLSGAIGGGMGYYSLTMALVSQHSGVEMGFIAFLANFIREVLTFLLSPLLARISSLAPIALGGATAMDTTLAMMKRCLNEEHALLAFCSGAALTLITPFLLILLL